MSTEKTRLYDFETDKVNVIPITAARVDAELDQIIAAINQKTVIKATAPGSPVEGMTWYDSTNKALKVYRNGAFERVDLPPGVIQMYGAASAPSGWLLCDGTAVSRTTYAGLFAIISTTFGVGDGSTTFNLPDMRQRFPIGKAASGTGSTLGGTGGLIDHVHTGPAHTHAAGTLAGPSHTHTNTTGGATDTGGGAQYHIGASDNASGTGSVTGSTETAGTGDTGVANPPFQAVNFIIKT